MSDHLSDSQLDALLRDVPLAEGYVERLKASLFPSDDVIDRTLGAVAVPSTLSARLRNIPDDVALDERLASLPTPARLAERLYAIPRERADVYRRPTAARRAVETVGMSIAVSLALVAMIVLAVGGAYPVTQPQTEIAEVPVLLESSAEFQFVIAGFPADDGSDSGCEWPIDPASDGMTRWVSLDQGRSALVIDEASADLLEASPPSLGPVGEWVALTDGGLRAMDDVVLMKFGVLGSPQYTNDLLPDLEAPWTPTPRGMDLPLVRGYDRVFYLRNRVSPPIPPAADELLANLVAPLSVRTDAYRRTRDLLARGRLPLADEVRVEDFLAAMDYHLPPAPVNELAIRTAAGPSPFGAVGTGMLQVAVQAGGVQRDPKRSSHLVLAIDGSQSMGRAGRWAELTLAVRKLLDSLAAQEHVSLVVFQDEGVQRWEDVGRDTAAEIAAEFESLVPAGSTNLAFGLQQAVSVALSQESAQTKARHIVLVTDDPSAIAVSQQAAVRAMLASAADAQVTFDVVDMGPSSPAKSLVADLATQMKGDYRRLNDGQAMGWMLLERLAERSSVVASEARLTIRFNPEAVAAYRLIGHEANALAGLSPPSVEAELRAGDCATVLAEVWLQSGDVDDVAEATLTWRDPATGESRKRTQRISRLQFAPTFAEAAPSLQAAAIAAEMGEVLRGSRDALRQANPALPKSSWDTLQRVAGEVNPIVRKWPDFARVMELAERAKSARQ